MGRIYNGVASLPNNYKVGCYQPIDIREIVQSFSDLLDISNSFYETVYEGMRVLVLDECCVYQLVTATTNPDLGGASIVDQFDFENTENNKKLWKRLTIETITTKEALQRAKDNLVNGALIYIANAITLDDGTTQKSGFYFCQNVDGEGVLTLAGGGEIVDNLTTQEADKALSANQGVELSKSITNLSNETNTRLGALSNNITNVEATKNYLEVGEGLTISNKKDAYVYKVPSDTTTDLVVAIDEAIEEGKLKEVILIIDNSDNNNTCMIALPNEGVEVIYNIEDMYVKPGLSSEFSLLIDTTGDTTIIRVAGLIKE